jgi:murein DD-endopeptidase MepM/ murein hydrolase activator NlpD
MFKKLIKSIIIITVISVLVLSGNIMIALATSQSDLNNIQSEINNTKKEINNVGDKISETMKQVQTLSTQIAGYESEIEDLDVKIDELTNKINEAAGQIKVTEEKYNHQLELLKARLVAIYEAGETSYLDVLLASKSITDFITKYYTISEILESDKNLMEQMEQTRISLEESKNLLETGKEQVEALKKSKVDTASSLKQSQAVKQSYVDQLSEQEKALEAQLQEQEKEEQRIKNELAQKEKQYENEIANLGGSGTLQKPVKTGVITATWYYPSGRFHGALDYGIPVGTKVYAAEEGIVLKAGWSSSGYGFHVWIQHANGLRTCYAHGCGTIYVKEGWKVEKGQLIMLSGNTGNSTGPHLHFEVRVYPYSFRYGGGGNDCRRDPRNYL